MAEPLLVLENVRKRYGETLVLDGIDLELERGELCALLGPSGSGKSTLLNIIGCLDRPSSGRVVVAGQDTARLDGAELTRLRGAALGFVFQFHHLLPAFTALENVMMPALAQRGRPDAAMRARALEMLDRVGLAAKAGRRATQLSGGEQQRVAVARALAGHPPLVLADEPTGNLDSRNADRLFELLRELERELGTSFLVVTHDPRLAARCERRIEILDGRIVADSGRIDRA